MYTPYPQPYKDYKTPQTIGDDVENEFFFHPVPFDAFFF